MATIFDRAPAAPAAVDLSGLLSEVAGRLRGIPDRWVKAEVSEIKSNAAGHTYMQLIQKDGEGPSSAVVATVRAVVWRSAAGILRDFQQVTGSPLSQGMTIVFHCAVVFHKVYGLQLNIDAIDTDFALGLRERQRRETIEYLSKTGLMGLQGKLPLPYLPGRIALVTSQTAAGYGDFLKHLSENRWGFRFETELYPALMQGDAAPASIIEAMSLAVASGAGLILVFRGGGADSDMFCFDDCALCEAVCRCPVPVFSAVGHEKDHHVIDDCAAASFKTPTALADHLLTWVSSFEDAVTVFRDGIRDAAARRIFDAEKTIGSWQVAQARRFLLQCDGMNLEVKDILAGIGKGVTKRRTDMEAVTRDCLVDVVRAVEGRARAVDAVVTGLQGNIAFAVRSVLKDADSTVEKECLKIEAADPRKILSQGYVLAVDAEGNVLKGASSRSVGEAFMLRHADGRWDCRVEGVVRK